MTESLEQMLERHKNEIAGMWDWSSDIIARHHNESVAWYKAQEENGLDKAERLIKEIEEGRDRNLLDQAALAILEGDQARFPSYEVNMDKVWKQALKFVESRPK